MSKIKRYVAKLLLIVIAFTQTSFASTLEVKNARSYILYNMETDSIIASSNNINEAVPIASVSKLMTFYIALNKIKDGDINLDDEVVIKKRRLLPNWQ